jgi:hypothetical protein
VGIVTLLALTQLLTSKKIGISVRRDKLVVNGPSEAMTPELRAELTLHKPALLAMLAAIGDGPPARSWTARDASLLDLAVVEACRLWPLDDRASIAELIEQGRRHNETVLARGAWGQTRSNPERDTY